jgi:hypothetical protein
MCIYRRGAYVLKKYWNLLNNKRTAERCCVLSVRPCKDTLLIFIDSTKNVDFFVPTIYLQRTIIENSSNEHYLCLNGIWDEKRNTIVKRITVWSSNLLFSFEMTLFYVWRWMNRYVETKTSQINSKFFLIIIKLL